MKEINVGTRKMMDEYCYWHFEKGLTPKEIAKKFRLSYSCVISHLGEIARENGCTREELLESPNRSGERIRYCGRLKTVDPLDLDDLKGQIQGSLKFAGELEARIDDIVKRERARER